MKVLRKSDWLQRQDHEAKARRANELYEAAIKGILPDGFAQSLMEEMMPGASVISFELLTSGDGGEGVFTILIQVFYDGHRWKLVGKGETLQEAWYAAFSDGQEQLDEAI